MKKIVWCFLASILLLFAQSFSQQPADKKMLNESEKPGSQFTHYKGSVTEPAISPDGDEIAFCWTGKEGKRQNLYVRAMKTRESEPRQLTFNEKSDYHPAWSPDRKFIAFHRVERVFDNFMLHGIANIYQIPVNGGKEKKLTSGWQPDWSPDGSSLVFCAPDTVEQTCFISMLDLETLETKVLARPDSGFYDYYPAFSPDGKKVAFLRTSNMFSKAHPDELYTISGSMGKPVRLTFDDANIHSFTWAPDGRNIVFSSNRGGTLALWNVSLENREISPVPARGAICTDPEISKDGSTLCYIVLDRGANTIDRYDISNYKSGKNVTVKQIVSEVGAKNADYSPDGQEIVFMSSRSGSREIWKCDKEGNSLVQLTSFNGPRVTAPRWSPDGEWICFDAVKGVNRSIFKVRAGGGPSIQLTSELTDDRYPVWSSDGKWVYYKNDGPEGPGIWKVSADAPLSEPKFVCYGWDMRETGDGNFLYFIKSLDGHPALFKSLQSGKDSLVFCPKNSGLVDTRMLTAYRWEPSDQGMYFLGPDENDAGIVRFYDFASRTITDICTVSHSGGNIDVSPDQKYLLHSSSSVSIQESNIWLIEH